MEILLAIVPAIVLLESWDMQFGDTDFYGV